MFTIGDYKIVFRRKWHDKERHLRSCDRKKPCLCNKGLKINGRYDTVCEIFHQNILSSIVTVKLHPNDQVDRIVGKKLALKRALDAMLPSDDQKYGDLLSVYYERKFKNRAERTAIWGAFWSYCGYVAEQARK
ncbi:MAG: hypothetical protein IMZ70_01325 [Candidatus Atribacteria bacterium]|nr:hypothetical protein [Candidatus Atribacteria bacterium]MBE3145003.1 hypothetical protein [Planctomycetota bacterium]